PLLPLPPLPPCSILIFMALRNSRTGSLPVSEIYNFMTEHFPYFKTAPDGWKNSVRHNLSLNKCFEKVENKTSSSSRKGCLWALNPSKVEKMQEELHKWRRKDPVTVRKSMARPDQRKVPPELLAIPQCTASEELDRLLGDKPEKFKALSAPPPPAGSFGHRLLTREAGSFEMPPSYGAARPGTANPALRCPPQGRPTRQQPPYLPPATPAFSYFSPGIPPGTGSLDSPVPVQSPPAPGAALLAEHCASRSMQELLLEGELSNDIDTLNPSLTDLQLHGNLWEELKDDSLALDSLVVIATLPSSPFPDHAQDGFSSVGREPSVPSAEEEEEEGNLADVCITGIYSTAFSNLEHVSYLSAPTGTAIPLL
ncbi:FOXN1 protein, partial [Amia calva]|nr:FOXN1 protein [Amia calva]